MARTEPRIARHKAEVLESTVSLLRLAASNLELIDRSPAAIQHEIQLLTNEIVLLQGRAGLHIDGRAKPKLSSWHARRQAPCFYVYVDECGTRQPSIQPGFQVFTVAAVVVEQGHYEKEVRRLIHELKLEHWPETAGRVILHEPDMRRRRGKFFFGGDLARQQAFDDRYRELLQRIDFRCVGAVVDKGELLAMQGSPGDQYLPKSLYAIAYVLLLEQVCALLRHECGDAVGSVYPESIGDEQDVELQFEHARVFKKGTLRVSGSWLRHQIRPGLRFFTKGEAEGNELADTVARTVADHANGEEERAAHWDCISPKLYLCTDFQSGGSVPASYARFPQPRAEKEKRA